MAAILSRLASMPRSDTMYPSSLPLGTPKRAFLGIQLDVESLEICERGAQGGDQVVRARCFDDDVINVDRDRHPRLVRPVGVDRRVDLVGEAGFACIVGMLPLHS